MSQSDGNSRDGLMLLYQVTVGDLTYFKSQQWAVVNHVFLLLAALVAARQLLDAPVMQWEAYTLALLALGVVVAGMIVLAKLQESIVVRQARLEAAREKLGLEFYSTWAAKDKGAEYIHSIGILRGAMLIGGFVVCWLLLRSVV